MSEENKTATESSLIRLAREAGILSEYTDIEGTEHITGPELSGAILSAIGLAGNPEDVLLRERTRKLRNVLPAVIITGQRDLHFEFSLPEQARMDNVQFQLELEGGLGLGLRAAVELKNQDWVDSIRYNVYSAVVPDDFPPGTHTLRLVTSAGVLASASVIVCPERCYIHPEIDEGARWNGIWLQLYALRSSRNWGVGELADLAELARITGPAGIRVLGLSPLHTPFFGRPDMRSPYSPSSRLFKNPMFISIWKLQEFQASQEAQDLARSDEFLEYLSQTRRESRIDYASLFIWKFRFFEVLFHYFLSVCTDLYENPGAESITYVNQGLDFLRYMEEGGESLLRQATFDALEEKFMRSFDKPAGFHGWPEEYWDPSGNAVVEFQRLHMKRVLYFVYLQYLFDRQFAEVQDECLDRGVRLYVDLAVGSHPGGAEVWSRQSAYVAAASVGAPPDPFAPQGQDWGLLPLNPLLLKEQRYAPFIEILERNLPDGGIARLDHVMALYRLYFVTQTPAGRRGAYVRYPFQDLLRLLALVSQQKNCMIIGEDLGTVPDDFRAALSRSELFSWKIAFFEREGKAFRDPATYPVRSVATLNTHDLPTLRGWKSGKDIQAREELGFLSAEEASEMRADRALEVSLALDLAFGPREAQNFVPASDDELYARLYEKLLSSSSGIRLVSLYDLFEEENQPNLPGTVDEYPSWGTRNTCRIEDLVTRPLFKRLWIRSES